MENNAQTIRDAAEADLRQPYEIPSADGTAYFSKMPTELMAQVLGIVACNEPICDTPPQLIGWDVHEHPHCPTLQQFSLLLVNKQVNAVFSEIMDNNVIVRSTFSVTSEWTPDRFEHFRENLNEVLDWRLKDYRYCKKIHLVFTLGPETDRLGSQATHETFCTTVAEALSQRPQITDVMIQWCLQKEGSNKDIDNMDFVRSRLMAQLEKMDRELVAYRTPVPKAYPSPTASLLDSRASTPTTTSSDSDSGIGAQPTGVAALSSLPSTSAPASSESIITTSNNAPTLLPSKYRDPTLLLRAHHRRAR
ncbi:hypothetical protein H2203_003855 [Taxawa tesnikishii (nom. ined.)]|nr:hypothetical protein H2203_003855 [Dothideales sp. JES 119]